MGTSEYTIRPATGEDLPIIREALAWAIYWREPALPGTAEECVARTGHDYLLADWGREGDVAVVAETSDGRIGAAWYRFWTAEKHSYGYVDAAIPEMGIGIEPGHRGRGVGTALLGALLGAAVAAGVQRMSLSVEADNPAMVLYERLGFERFELVEDSWTMVVQLEGGELERSL